MKAIWVSEFGDASVIKLKGMYFYNLTAVFSDLLIGQMFSAWHKMTEFYATVNNRFRYRNTKNSIKWGLNQSPCSWYNSCWHLHQSRSIYSIPFTSFTVHYRWWCLWWNCRGRFWCQWIFYWRQRQGLTPVMTQIRLQAGENLEKFLPFWEYQVRLRWVCNLANCIHSKTSCRS